MTWTLSMPSLFYYIFLGVAVVALLSILLKKTSRTKKIVSSVLLIVVLTIVTYFITKPTIIRVTPSEIAINKRHIPYGQISEAVVMKTWVGTPYQPTMRIGGTSAGKLRTGHFKLKNGKRAYLAVWLDGRILRVVTQDSSIYLIAPQKFDEFLTEIQKYITVMPDTSRGINP